MHHRSRPQADEGAAQSPFEVRSSSIGHGKGVFAATDLTSGTVVHVEKPLWSASILGHDAMKIQVAQRVEAMNNASGMQPAERASAVQAAFHDLWRNQVANELKRHKAENGGARHAETMRRLLTLDPFAQVLEGDPYYARAVAVFENNNFFSHSTGQKWDARNHHHVYEVASRFQHSCSPNLEVCPIDDAFAAVAIRRIRKGDELFIDYCEASGEAEQLARRALVLEKRGFECACPRCASNGRLVSMSFYQSIVVFWAFVRLYLTICWRRWWGSSATSNEPCSASRAQPTSGGGLSTAKEQPGRPAMSRAERRRR